MKVCQCVLPKSKRQRRKHFFLFSCAHLPTQRASAAKSLSFSLPPSLSLPLSLFLSHVVRITQLLLLFQFWFQKKKLGPEGRRRDSSTKRERGREREGERERERRKTRTEENDRSKYARMRQWWTESGPSTVDPCHILTVPSGQCHCEAKNIY